MLRAIRWGMYGENGLPGNASHFSLHLAEWQPDEDGLETSVTILFETDGSTRDHAEGKRTNTVYELRRSVMTVGKEPTQGRKSRTLSAHQRKRRNCWSKSRMDHGSRTTQGVDTVIGQLLPFGSAGFFRHGCRRGSGLSSAEARTRSLNRRAVIKKTSFAVGALLGLDVFRRRRQESCSKRSPTRLVGRRQRPLGTES